jgi:hypothetical protein
MNWLKSVNQSYPNAAPCNEIFTRANEILACKGLDADNTLFAVCCCRDEINKTAIHELSSKWGENFDLSGLAGFPTAGITGLTAYSHHVPDDGNLFIFYGPHIGFDEDGRIGLIRREGMSKNTASCGSLIHYLSKFEDDTDYAPLFDPNDVGQYFVEFSLYPEAAEVASADNSVFELTNLAFEKIEKSLLEIIRLSNVRENIYLLGGVLINNPVKGKDYFDPRSSLFRRQNDTVYCRGWFE